jgi:tetratricopeptide (TPR) repeat protein
MEGVARLYARSSHAAWWDDNPTLSLQLGEEGLRATESAPESPGMARLLHEAARAYYFCGFPEQAERFCQQALEMSERLDVVRVQADALITLGSLPNQVPEDALRALTRAVQLAESAKLMDVAFRAHHNLALVKSLIYGVEVGREEAQRAAQLSRQMGNVAQEIRALSNLVEAFLILGELEQAQGALDRIRLLAADLDDPGSVAARIRRLQAVVLLYEGEWPKAASSLRLCRAEARQHDDLQALFNVDLFLARASLEAYTLAPGAEDPAWEEVEGALTEAMEIDTAMGGPDTNVWCGSYMAVIYAGQGRLEEAQKLQAEGRNRARDWRFPAVKQALLWAEARLAAAKGCWAEALTSFESLAGSYGRCGMRWDRARTLVDWADACRSHGLPADITKPEFRTLRTE